jgi:hypothetical protein
MWPPLRCALGVIGNPFGDLVGNGAGQDFGARFLRQLQCLSGRVFFEKSVKQDAMAPVWAPRNLRVIGYFACASELRSAGVEGTNFQLSSISAVSTPACSDRPGNGRTSGALSSPAFSPYGGFGSGSGARM